MEVNTENPSPRTSPPKQGPLAANGRYYSGAGIKTSVTGTVYQIELLKLFINRGLRVCTTFCVATEVASAGAFDDLVFEYETTTTNGVIFLQAKHRTNLDKKIREIDLTGVVNGDFYIPKYFESYRKIMSKMTKEFNGDKKQFVIFTPINIDDDILNNFEDVSLSREAAEDSFLYFDPKVNNSKRPSGNPNIFKIRKDSLLYNKLVELLEKNIERSIVAMKLGKTIASNNAIIVEDVFKKHHDWLLDNVLDGDNVTMITNKAYIRFKQTFLTTNDVEVSGFRTVFLQNYLVTRNKESKKKQYETDKKNEVIESENIHNIIDILMEENPKFQIANSFLKSKFKKLKIDASFRKEIESFFYKFALATNQPNNEELKQIIRTEIGEIMELGMDESKWVESRLQSCILDWLEEEKSRFLTYDDCKAFFDYVEQEFSKRGQAFTSLAHVSHIVNYGYTFNTDGNLIGTITNFLDGSGSLQMLCVCYTNRLLTQIKLCQMSPCNQDFMFGELKKLSLQYGTKMCPIKASHLINHIVLEIDNCSNLSTEENKLLQNITEIVKNDVDKKKRIIVMVAKDQQTSWEKIMVNCNYKTLSDSENNFSDLSEKSKEKLLKTATVRFNGRKFSLGTLLSMTCIEHLSGDKLCELINNTDNLDIERAPANVLYDSVKAYYIERKLSRCNEIQKWLPLLKSNNDKIIIVKAAPGMGKSTELSYLENNINLYYPEYFCVRTNLVDNCHSFVDLNKEDMTNESIKFLYKISGLAAKNYEGDICGHITVLDNGDLKLNDSPRATFDDLLRISLFCYVYNEGNTILLLDGFDEISPQYNEKVIRLIQTLKVMKISKMCITTRPYDLVNELEDKLSAFSYNLEPLSVDEQKNLLFNLWKVKLRTVEVIGETQVIAFLELLKGSLFKHFQQNNEDYMSTFMSIPLHVFMLATTEEKRFLEFVNKKDNIYLGNYNEYTNFSIYTIYNEFFKIKFNDILYPETDIKVPKYNILLRDKMKKTMIDNGKLALLELFEDVPEPLVCSDDRENLNEEVMVGEEKTGFVDIVEGKPRFLHRTYAEFFAAHFLADTILKSKEYKSKAVKEFLYKTITKSAWMSSVTFIFFNYEVVSRSKNYTPIFNSALNGNVQEVMESENVADIQDDLGRTSFHLLFYSGLVYDKAIDIFEKYRSAMFVEDNLFKWSPLHYAMLRHDCNKTLSMIGHQLVAKSPEAQFRDINGRTPLMMATQGICRRNCVFNYIYDFSLEIDAQDKTGKTALHYAIINDYQYAFLLLASIVHLGGDLNIQDCEGKTPLHYAIEKHRLLAVNHLIEMGADVTLRDNNGRIPSYFDMSELLNGNVCYTLHFINQLKPKVMQLLVSYMELSRVDLNLIAPYYKIARYLRMNRR